MTISPGRKGKAKEALANYEKTKPKAIESVDYRNGVTTRCIIYNATGDKIEFSGLMDFLGTLFQVQRSSTRRRYIGNGEWDYFLHVHTNDFQGSAGAISYYIENMSAARSPDFGYHVCDAVLGWSSPYRPYRNKAYTEITKPFHINSDNAWNDFANRMYNSWYDKTAIGHGFKSIVATETGYNPLFVGLITLEGLHVHRL